MTKTKKILATLAILTSLTACDRIGGRELAKERADRRYRTAMDDYQAGRLPQAVEGLKEVCGKDPANASARFQLACLLQDFSKDYFGAACAFNEYLMQRPDSDKAKLAKDRLSACEKGLANVLCDKYGLNSVSEQQKLLEAAHAEYKGLEARNKKLSSDLESAMRRIASLSQEADRLKVAIAAAADDETESAADPEIKAAKTLLGEGDVEDSGAAQALEEEKKKAKSLLDDDDANAKPMLAQDPDAKKKRDEAKAKEEAARREAAAKAVPLHEKRPDTYVVQEGDTLYKIAIRFYGRSSAWSLIRDANKATISMDGRVRTGQTINLPAPVK